MGLGFIFIYVGMVLKAYINPYPTKSDRYGIFFSVDEGNIEIIFV